MFEVRASNNARAHDKPSIFPGCRLFSQRATFFNNDFKDTLFPLFQRTPLFRTQPLFRYWQKQKHCELEKNKQICRACPAQVSFGSQKRLESVTYVDYNSRKNKNAYI